jgi:pyruvate/2-oxoglutarate/acetoin dehydrogenase E1 component/TPP-dependent pyruvate/acetoin dehydrogenase alpha subunit
LTVDPSSEMQVGLYRTMTRIRLFEESIGAVYIDEMAEGRNLLGELHLSIGQEAVAAGISAHLQREDSVTSYYRGHGHAIAKGVDIGKIAAEILGRETGLCRGKGGHMHLFDASNNFSTTGIVGAQLPLGLGPALAFKILGKALVSTIFFGDGAANQGTFHESMNLASVWKLPVVFVCEDNAWAMSVPKEASTSVKDNAQRAAGYNMPGIVVDGNDVFAAWEVARDAVARARSGKGPTLLDCKTHRFRGHIEGDQQIYRSKEEADEWLSKDPITRMKKHLLERGLLTQSESDRIEAEEKEKVHSAIEFGRRSPWPRAEESVDSVFEETSEPSEPPIELGAREITFGEAITEAMRQEMERDSQVILLGEDVRVGLGGGAFGCSTGLHEQFGDQRVLDTPISESAFIGASIGAASAGLRPIVELQFIDFFGVAMDQIYNQMAKIHYMSAGGFKVPLVLRAAMGGGYGDAAQGSQCLYAIFAHVPGLKVAVPSSPYDAKGLLIRAIRCDDPVLFLEHKLLYNVPFLPFGVSGPVPDQEYEIPFGKAVKRRTGKDVTVVAVALMVHKSLAAAGRLAKEGIDLEIIDLRTIVPLDKESILESVAKTGRLLVVDEDYLSFGLSGEIIALTCERLEGKLKRPPRRIAVPDVPIPASYPMEQYVIPSEERIYRSVKSLM